MNKLNSPSFVRVRRAALGALVGVMSIASHPVFAQQVSATPESAEEVSVVAPGMVQRKIVGRSTIGAPIETISLSRRVSYGDLDLTKQSDVEKLGKRIRNTARLACEQLDNLYPDGSLYQTIPSDQNCVNTATRKAIEEANLVIAGANQAAKKLADNQTARR
jgi:UrcA family protein